MKRSYALMYALSDLLNLHSQYTTDDGVDAFRMLTTLVHCLRKRGLIIHGNAVIAGGGHVNRGDAEVARGGPIVDPERS